MAGHGGRGRRGRGAAHAEHENDERWLLTYADMITLLMALFMVLFSISSVNISKYQTLQQSLKAAFSGSILPGGRSIMQSGSQSTTAHTPATAEIPSLVPLNPVAAAKANPSIASSKANQSSASLNSKQLEAALNSMSAALREQASLASLKQKLDAYSKEHGLSHDVQTVIDRRGLVVRVLTDQLLFASGQATLQTAGFPLLTEVAQLLNVDKSHPITVEGHTDNVPISSSQYPSNWELSTDRATTVVRYLIAKGVNRERLGAVGYADLHPLASNATAAGRAKNRRVEIVLQRINPVPPS
jgi:chemotaxis protein MotB